MKRKISFKASYRSTGRFESSGKFVSYLKNVSPISRVTSVFQQFVNM